MNWSKWIAILLALLLLAVAVGICGVYMSYNAPIVREYSYESSKITEPIKVVVLTDLHGNKFGEGNEELLEIIDAQRADSVFMVGDFLNKYDEEHGEVIDLVNSLTEIAPVYYALGNHEQKYMSIHGDQLLREIQDTEATFLDLTYQDIELNGQRIRLGGILDYAFALDANNSTSPETMESDVYQYLCEFQDSDDLKIMLAHRPESFVLGQASETWGVDLVISGHAHGGQVVLPFIGGLYGSDQGFLPDYVHGFHTKNKISILISSGLGSGFTGVPRFNNPPEVVVLTLTPEK